jgi:LCP family protein required for cell wall assembly
VNDRPRRPSLVPIILLLVIILLGAVGIFAYATIKPLVAMTGQVVPRLPVSGAAAPEAAGPGGGAKAGAPAVPGAGSNRANGPSAGATPAGGLGGALPEPTGTPYQLPSLQRKQRVNFLLLGSDTDLKFAPGQYLTQSMIIVSVDPVAHTVGMLSIPRDLWVRIPGYGYGKIQIAYEIGGIATARATIEQNFGIPIHYYAWVGLQGFQKMIDTVGGVTMDVTHPVLDDAYPDDLNASDPYAYMRLFLPPGPQHLDGVQALQFVRSRHGDLIGDFGRSGRQQQLLLALKQRLTGPTLITHLPLLASDMQDSVRTDVPLSDLLQYASFARDLNSDEIRQIVLQPPTYSSNGMTPDGTQAIVIPNWPAIDQVVTQMFELQPQPAAGTRIVPNGPLTVVATPAAAGRPQAPTDDTPSPVETERAAPTATPVPRPEPVAITVQVENGTAVPGLAERATQYLAGNGYRLASPVNGPRGVARTTVTFYDANARQAAFAVARLLGATVIAGNRPASAGAPVVVVLGSDAAKRF